MPAKDLGISPPPWAYDDNRDEAPGDCEVWAADDTVIYHGGNIEGNEYHDIANGRLAAAAPDLYDACELALAWQDYMPVRVVQALVAAMAKARGETTDPVKAA